MSQLPDRRLDRAALERVIQRAAELQAAERDIGDGLTTGEMLALAKDVGIPEAYVRRAMLEEQTRAEAPAPSGLLDHMAGRAVIETSRVVQGDVADVEQRLLAWMERHELLAIQRQLPGRISWEPLGGFAAAMKRSSAAFGGTRKPFMLGKAERVVATVVALEPGFCHVALRAELHRSRSAYVTGTAVAGGVGAASSGVLFALNAFWMAAVAPLPFAVFVGWMALRSYRPIAARTLLGLERALDELEHRVAELPAARGEPGFVGYFLKEVRKALDP